jgi:hypothetical protein
MRLYQAAARHRLGQLRGLETGANLCREAREWMSREGVVNPDAMLEMLAPGFDVD